MRARGRVESAGIALAAGLALVGALGLFATPGAAQTATPSTKEVAAAKAALIAYTAGHAPQSESEPTSLDACPWENERVADLAIQQSDFAMGKGVPTVTASVFLDETIDTGTRAIGCAADYTDKSGDSQFLSVVAYANPGLTTKAYGKALAADMKGKVRTVSPPFRSLLGGKVEGYCAESSSRAICAHVWSRDGLYVEIDSNQARKVDFTELRSVVPAVLDGLVTTSPSS